MKRVIEILAIILHLIIAVGATAGGLACLINPINPLGAPQALLEGSVFTTYLIPGLTLLILFGIGNAAQVAAVVSRHWVRGITEGVLGSAMLIWIVVQVLIIKDVVLLHGIFFATGIIQGLIGQIGRAHV